MLDKRKLILAKIETTAYTDSVPVAATNAILVANFSIKPMDGGSDTRQVVRPFFGADEVIQGPAFVSCSFDVELVNSGTAGTAPHYGALLRACGLAQTLNGIIDVSYLPVSSALERVTIYDHEDGILHKMIGSMGSVQLMFEAGKIPYYKFTFKGIRGAVTDTAIPTGAVYTTIKPVMVRTGNTTATIFGVAATTAGLKSLTFDLATDISFAPLVGQETINYKGRSPKGSAEVYAKTLATFDPFTNALNGTRGTISITHGTVAGNIVTAASATNGVSIMNPDYGEFEGEKTFKFDFILNPVVGNDELKITLT